MTNVETELALLKREVNDMKQIHVRLDTAIEKIADVSSSLKTIMSVHEAVSYTHLTLPTNREV